ncbi:MAG: cytochrome c3 family protein [Deltaproteobacteria bacterium]|nr:cytochrome c3 family protein [Deltaproteobacteria bacterium]
MVSRMTTVLAALTLLGLVACRCRVAAADEVIWIYPPPNSLVTESPVPLYGYVTGSPRTSLEAKVMGVDGSAQPQREPLFLFRGKIFSGSLTLTPGRNNVVVSNTVLPLLYRPGAVETRDGVFRRPLPHGKKVESCSQCHTFARGEVVLKQKVPELCLSCHRVGTEADRAVIKKNKHTESVTPACLRCHEAHASFEGKLLRSSGASCTPCHQEAGYKGYTHDKGASPESCTICHDAHGSAFPQMMRGERIDPCKRCHKDVASPERYPRSFHAPVEEQRCFDCHAPHPQGGQPRLLKAAVPSLCVACHKSAKEGLHQGKLDECLGCHEPHASTRPRLLTAGATERCLGCHPERRRATGGTHDALKEGCTACHNPHNPRAKRESQKVCGACHRFGDTDFQSAHGGLLMPDAAQCVLCHDPHSSTYPSMLRGTVHYPLKNGGCASCHVEKDGKLDLRYGGSENCLRCHGQITGTSVIKETDKVHKPVSQIDCIACHNPHLGARPRLLLEEPVTLCGWCHGTLLRGVDNVHGVFKEGGTCYTCHLPHISDFKPLLKRPEEELCLRCHVKTIPQDAGGRRLLHGAVEQSRCTGCHNPHGTNTEKLLRGTRDALCLACHQKAVRSAEGKPWKYLHGPVGTGNCTACHTLGHAHASAGDRFLKTKGSRVCALCHETKPDHVKENYRAKMREVQNDCLVCHQPHGGSDKFLMRSDR